MTPKLRVIAKYSIIGILLTGIGVTLPELLRWLMSYFRKEVGHEIGEFQKEWVQILMGLAVLAGAYGLYRLREKQRFIYAAAELLVAYLPGQVFHDQVHDCAVFRRDLARGGRAGPGVAHHRGSVVRRGQRL